MEMGSGDGVRIRGDGSFDSWGELLVGRDELLIFEMRPLIHGSGTFGLEDLRALKIQDGTGGRMLLLSLIHGRWTTDP